MLTINKEQARRMRQDAYFAFCAKNKIEPSPQVEKIWDDGFDRGIDFVGDSIVKEFEARTNAAARGVPQRETKNVFNLWGLMK